MKLSKKCKSSSFVSYSLTNFIFFHRPKQYSLSDRLAILKDELDAPEFASPDDEEYFRTMKERSDDEDDE